MQTSNLNMNTCNEHREHAILGGWHNLNIKTRQGQHRREKTQATSLRNLSVKLPPNIRKTNPATNGKYVMTLIPGMQGRLDVGNCVKVPQHRHATTFTDLKEKNHVVNLDCRVCSLVHVQDGAKVSLQWFVWKTMQLINKY